MRNLTYEERLKKLDLPTLVYRRARGDMIEVFRIMQEKYDNNVVPRWERSQGATMGHQFKLFKRSAVTKVRSHYIMYRVVDAWNGLPESVVNAPSIYAFESRLDNYWKDQDFRFNSEATLNITRTTEVINQDLDIEV
ncbi:hypothetical protein Pcinc_016096 [Petrolisthes cinctipes]|uniref:Uncharacterized protein n=1 Tax=Petrolisthes cinctipes TaxID=88211 RepID=A0AAE1FT29_PETCI|nr:hypothetical protein Pcinc_016096 [Petrolisthes cinctipes]